MKGAANGRPPFGLGKSVPFKNQLGSVDLALGHEKQTIVAYCCYCSTDNGPGIAMGAGCPLGAE